MKWQLYKCEDPEKMIDQTLRELKENFAEVKKETAGDQVLTIPNLLSVIRLALIPLIVWLYIGKQEYSAAVAVILISGATDIIDGFIARKFNMVSDLGKILDPVADKLTQATVILCLTVKYRWMRGLIVLFVVKEIIMAVLGYMAIQKKDVVNSAKWYG